MLFARCSFTAVSSEGWAVLGALLLTGGLGEGGRRWGRSTPRFSLSAANSTDDDVRSGTVCEEDCEQYERVVAAASAQ